MSDPVQAVCPLCDRPVGQNQKRCVCGAVLHRDVPVEDGSRFDFAILLPLIPLAATGFLVWRITADPMLQYSVAPVIKIYAVTAIASAMVALLVANSRNTAAVDQSELPADSPGRLSPTSWFTAVLLLWPVYFPIFLYAHFRESAPVKMIASTLAAGLFFLTFLYVFFALRTASPDWPAAPEPKQVRPHRTPAPTTAATVTEPGFAPALPPKPGTRPMVTATPSVAAPRLPAELSVVPSTPPAALSPTPRVPQKSDDDKGAKASNVGISILKGPEGGDR